MIARVALFGTSGALIAGALWLSLAPVALPNVSAVPVNEHTPQTASQMALPATDPARIPARSLFRPMPPPPAPPPIVIMLPVMPPPEEGGAPLQPAQAEMRLVGLIEGGGEAVAFIEVQGRQEIQRRRLSEDLEGWKLVEIGRRDITLRKAGENKTLPLDPPRVP